jgi:hypothetical protein
VFDRSCILNGEQTGVVSAGSGRAELESRLLGDEVN